RQSNERASTAPETEEAYDSKTDVIKEISEYPLPTSFDVTKLLVEAGASYILNLCNPVDNVNRYISLKSKALNLGVYGADLSYAATYNQAQETMQYLDVSRELLTDLEIEAGFNEDMVSRIERSIDDVDSLINIISDSFFKTYEYLASNEQDDMSILVMAGSWIEALYITTQINLISKDNSEIIDIITDQKASLDKLLEVMAPISVIDTGADIYEGLMGLHEIYEQGGTELSSEQLKELISRTEKLRRMIIT
ncbi:MAG: hypothetical protein KAI95_18495, partial [Bacteroidales bacterium]|nr:hypothetical protein [Bacteroidales bacterium]